MLGSNVYIDNGNIPSLDTANQHRKRFYPRDSSPYIARKQTGSPFDAAMIKELEPAGNDLSTFSRNSDFVSHTIL